MRGDQVTVVLLALSLLFSVLTLTILLTYDTPSATPQTVRNVDGGASVQLQIESRPNETPGESNGS